MFSRLLVDWKLCAICFLILGSDASFGDELPKDSAKAQHTRSAIERGMKFLEKDAREWRQKRSCATCHHGVLTVWAMSEAKSHGYPVAPETLKEMTSWTMERFKDVDKPRDSRPGFNMVSTPALFLAVLSQTEPKQDVVSADLLRRIGDHLVRHQETDGRWAWTLAPPPNRFPPVFENDEVATIWGWLALDPKVFRDSKNAAALQEGRVKALTWLEKTPPTETTQAAGLRLLLNVRMGASGKPLQAAIDKFLALQNKDGGWGQLTGLASDAYATGQALFVLRLAGLSSDRKEIQRGIAFLVGNQRDDGSWPMTPRAQPGCKPASNPAPIIHFGSAWATIGLVKAAPK